MKRINVSTLFFVAFGLLAMSAEASQDRLKGIAIDEETGTRFSIIDESVYGLLDTCRGAAFGSLKTIGEVPSAVSLADDTVARSLVGKALRAAKRACPQFSVSGSVRLEIWLFKGQYTGRRSDAEVTAELKENFDRKIVWEYHNLAFERAQQQTQEAKKQAMLASGELRALPYGDGLLLVGTDTTTGTKFWNQTRSASRPCEGWQLFEPPNRLIGEVSRSVRLADDVLARTLVTNSAQFIYEKCNVKHFRVLLVYEGYQISQGTEGPAFLVGYSSFSPVEVDAIVGIDSSGKASIANYQNHAFEAEKRRIAKEAEQARLAREKAEKEVTRQTRWNAFARKYGVQELVKESDLFTNPFLYQGKTIAVVLQFERMMTANSATFKGGNGIFVVSSIPTGTYRSARGRSDLLAVRVVGMTELKGLPFVNSMQAPNLRFVGVHFCAESGCSDILK